MSPALALQSTQAPSSSGLTFVTGLMAIATLATVGFWSVWFFGGRTLLANAQTDVYLGFEHALPGAEVWVTTSALCGWRALLRRRSSAMLWLISSGSACLYLGLMHLLFDLENNLYASPWPNPLGLAIEAAITSFALVGGATALRFGWAYRAYFLELDDSPNAP